LISVQDSGIGIKKEDHNKLFKLFVYLDITKELNTKGIGLGLHICKEITKIFGGDIYFESKWKKGTKFTYFIPLDDKSNKKNEVIYRC
jgi:signal transduction histidine kinase